MNIDALTQRLDALEAENHRLAGRVRELEARAEPSPSVDEPIDRRALLKKLGGAAVAGAGLAAGAALVRPDAAAADTGQNFILGNPNTASTETSLSGSASTGTVFRASATTGTTDGVTGGSQAGTGVVGVGATGVGVRGVSGLSNAVVGEILAFPFPAPVNNFSAVYGKTATAGAGVHGDSVAGWGLVGEIGSGGRGQLWLKPGASPTPPGGLNRVGEFYVGSTGTLFECVAGGEPGTWLRVGFNPTEPTRICDTRDEQGSDLNTYAAQRLEPQGSAGDTLTVTVTGPIGNPPVTVVPTQASAVVLTVTATTITAPGFLTVYPAGSPRPNASNVNFAAKSAVPVPAVPNLVVVKLGPVPSTSQTGINIFNGSPGPLDVIVDVAGFFS